MAAHDVAVGRVAVVAGLVLLMVATVIGAVLAILAAWDEPWGGDPGNAARIVRAPRAAGPAPQIDHGNDVAAKASQRAASKAPR